jgi:cobalamin synthase
MGITPQEKRLYHQIHPLKLGTDISAEFVSLYLFWKRKLFVGLAICVIPSIVSSALIMAFANLEKYKQSSFGKYIRTYMTPGAVILRMLGTIVSHIGAWYRKPALISLGWIVVLLGWLQGQLWPKKATAEAEH